MTAGTCALLFTGQRVTCDRVMNILPHGVWHFCPPHASQKASSKTEVSVN